MYSHLYLHFLSLACTFLLDLADDFTLSTTTLAFWDFPVTTPSHTHTHTHTYTHTHTNSCFHSNHISCCIQPHTYIHATHTDTHTQFNSSPIYYWTLCHCWTPSEWRVANQKLETISSVQSIYLSLYRYYTRSSSLHIQLTLVHSAFFAVADLFVCLAISSWHLYQIISIHFAIIQPRI